MIRLEYDEKIKLNEYYMQYAQPSAWFTSIACFVLFSYVRNIACVLYLYKLFGHLL